MIRRQDVAMVRYELVGFLRSNLPRRFLLLIPAGIFLAVWTWNAASPFSAVIWIVLVGLEPRLNNIFYHSPVELETLSLFAVDWKRIVVIKNLSTSLIAVGAMLLVSAVLLYFSPAVLAAENLRGAALYLATVAFPLLSLGNENSVRYPRRSPTALPAGLYEAVWISLTLAVLSIPYFLITDLLELPWLCMPYAAVTWATWYYRSVAGTSALINNRRIEIWTRADASSSS